MQTIIYATESGLHAKKATILVLDDDPAVRRLCRRVLENAGYRVITEATTEAALAHAASSGEPIDLLITDLSVPESTGEDLVADIRALRPHLPVILHTGDHLHADEHGPAFIRAKVDRVLQKPVSVRDMAAAVRALLETTPAAAAAAG
jgi:DNA-binding response OmpR family regulator